MINALIVFLIVILAIVCLLMIFAVLMQRPKQEGLGAAFGGGITDQVWGAQTTNVLQKATVILAITFFVITLILSDLLPKSRNMEIPVLKLRVVNKPSDRLHQILSLH